MVSADVWQSLIGGEIEDAQEVAVSSRQWRCEWGSAELFNVPNNTHGDAAGNMEHHGTKEVWLGSLHVFAGARSCLSKKAEHS